MPLPAGAAACLASTSSTWDGLHGELDGGGGRLYVALDMLDRHYATLYCLLAVWCLSFGEERFVS